MWDLLAPIFMRSKAHAQSSRRDTLRTLALGSRTTHPYCQHHTHTVSLGSLGLHLHDMIWFILPYAPQHCETEVVFSCLHLFIYFCITNPFIQREEIRYVFTHYKLPISEIK